MSQPHTAVTYTAILVLLLIVGVLLALGVFHLAASGAALI